MTGRSERITNLEATGRPTTKWRQEEKPPTPTLTTTEEDERSPEDEEPRAGDTKKQKQT